nr:MAG TPA: hypothetical protein [Caudoviricetes sp.]
MRCAKSPGKSCSGEGKLSLWGWVFPPGQVPFRRFSPPIYPFDKSTR